MQMVQNSNGTKEYVVKSKSLSNPSLATQFFS